MQRKPLPPPLCGRSRGHVRAHKPLQDTILVNRSSITDLVRLPSNPTGGGKYHAVHDKGSHGMNVKTVLC